MSLTTTPTDLSTDYLDRWHAARDAREELRRSEYGYLSYAGFHPLSAEPLSVDGIPGRWTTGPDGPAVELADDETLVVDGALVTGGHRFEPVGERELRRAAQAGDVVLELSKRGGVDLLRPLDPAFGRRANEAYDHTPAYAPDPSWIVEGRFEPFDEIRPTPFAATIGDLTHVHSVAGEVVATIAGTQHRLLVLARDGQEAGAAGAGIILFTDGTSGTTTDPQGRSLPIEFPAEAGPVTLDFNFTQNLQRPYTRFAPCPLPPAQNAVAAPIQAGEQSPVFRD